MARALPILVILGLAVYSFFDVLQTKPGDFRRFSRTSWLVIVLIPILGAALWFIAGRPRRSRKGYGPPRIISLRGSQQQVAPDDDPTPHGVVPHGRRSPPTNGMVQVNFLALNQFR